MSKCYVVVAIVPGLLAWLPWPKDNKTERVLVVGLGMFIGVLVIANLVFVLRMI